MARRAAASAGFFALTAALALGAACGGERPAALTLDAPPERVVVLGPSTVETLFALGLGDRVVGVSDYCVEPLAEALPRVGGPLNPSFERLAALEPELVVSQGNHHELERWCAQSGVALLALTTDRWEEWEDEVVALGELFEVDEAATELILIARQQLDSIRELAALREHRPRTLLVIGRADQEAAGLMVAGGSSFLTELLEVAGGVNVFDDNPNDYFDLNEEALIRAAPEVILEFGVLSTQSASQARAAWRKSFPELPAVVDDRIHPLAPDFVLLPGPRMPLTAALFAHYLGDRP